MHLEGVGVLKVDGDLIGKIGADDLRTPPFTPAPVMTAGAVATPLPKSSSLKVTLIV